MTARRAALAVLVATAVLGPSVAWATDVRSDPCAPPHLDASHGFNVAASSPHRTVVRGQSWLSTVVVERRVGGASVPASHVFVALDLHLSDGRWVSTTGRTDGAGRYSFALSVPRNAALGPADALWSAVESAKVPCGPRVHSYGEVDRAQAVRVTR